MQAAAPGTPTLLAAPDGTTATAARQSFALVGAQDFFESLEPPLRFTKIGRRVQTAF